MRKIIKNGVFKVGKSYRYLGKKRGENWNENGDMDGMLDGKPHKCLSAGLGFFGMPCAAFSGLVDEFEYCWDDDEFEEVEE